MRASFRGCSVRSSGARGRSASATRSSRSCRRPRSRSRQPAVLARAELQRALARLLEDEAVIGDAALAAAPDRRRACCRCWGRPSRRRSADRPGSIRSRAEPRARSGRTRTRHRGTRPMPSRRAAAAPEPVVVTAGSAARGARGSNMSGGSFRLGARHRAPARVADQLALEHRRRSRNRGCSRQSAAGTARSTRPNGRQIGRLIDHA